MKKSYKFNELSTSVCQGKGCEKRLKLRRVVEHGDTLCYRCYLKKQLRAGKWNYHSNKLRKAWAGSWDARLIEVDTGR